MSHGDSSSLRTGPSGAESLGVSFVMPVLNERAYLEHAVRSVLTQDVDGPMELILALGPSTAGWCATRLPTSRSG